MSFITELAGELDERIQALTEEISRIEAAKAALTNGHAHRPRRGRPRKSTVLEGSRTDQILTFLGTVPDATASKIADAVGIARTQPFKILRELLASGEVEKVGRRYRLAAGKRRVRT